MADGLCSWNWGVRVNLATRPHRASCAALNLTAGSEWIPPSTRMSACPVLINNANCSHAPDQDPASSQLGPWARCSWEFPVLVSQAEMMIRFYNVVMSLEQGLNMSRAWHEVSTQNYVICSIDIINACKCVILQTTQLVYKGEEPCIKSKYMGRICTLHTLLLPHCFRCCKDHIFWLLVDSHLWARSRKKCRHFLKW